MSIRIVRNEQGNCINFYGSSNPTYWNACLSAEVDDTVTDTINVINDIITSQTGVTKYEFFQIPFGEFNDRDGNAFSTAQEAADYITDNANVIGLSGVGTDLNGETVCFRLDDTSTSVMLDNGYSYGVNTIKAIPDTDGTIHIKSKLGDITHFTGLEVGNACLDGNVIAGGLNDISNTLNELFTVGPFEAVVISDPEATVIADVSGVDAGYTLVGSTVVDPIGDDIAANSSSGNYAGVLSTTTIDQAGEYFTFDIREEGQIGFGLVHTQDSYDDGYYSGNASYANPTTFGTSNSAHYGFQFSHWFHPTPNGSWTNYGANTSYVMGSGWSNWESRDEWLAGEPVKIKVGIDESGFIAISSLQDDGATWIVHARTAYPVADGGEYRLGIKFAYPQPRLLTAPKVHLREPAAPTMSFRYIESPDGVFNYPLFTTEEEANYYDSENGGSGTSHTHTYADDPTNTTWYMPDTNGVMNGTSAPAADLTLGQAANYTEITSLTDTDLTPSAFSASDITQEEGTNVNIQVTPAGASWSTSVSITPSGSGLVYDGYSVIQGTLTDVGADTAYTISVTRANSYGSTTGTMTVTATDVAPVQTNDTPWTKALDFSGSNEHLKQVGNYNTTNPLRMSDFATNIAAPTTAGNTAYGSSVRPWATAIVFNIDNVSSNQHIWNQGEGVNTGDDNIYLRLSANKQLFFGWGREGSGKNECMIHPTAAAPNGYLGHNAWYGVYIAHNGTRLSATDATASNLADAFDIRIMNSAGNNWTIGSNLSVASAWTSTGARMDRSYTGDFTIGGRGNNRSFNGEVASMIVTTLRIGQPMPTDAEIEAMITDPVSWVADYKIGNSYRPTHLPTDYSNFQYGTQTTGRATQMWLMGDGTLDSYANGIRNEILDNDQNATKLQLNSMVSNDIQTVSIAGLS